MAQSATDAQRLAPDRGSAADHDPDMPFGGYSILSTAFVVGVVGSVAAAKRSRGGLPPRYSPWDLVTAGTATHKISRMLTKDRVASVIRTPFVEGQERTGHGEVSGEPRGRGLQRAVGELLTCPHCLGQWIAAGFGVGMVAAPEALGWSPSSTAPRPSATSSSSPTGRQPTRSMRRRRRTSSRAPSRSRTLPGGPGASPARAHMRRSWTLRTALCLLRSDGRRSFDRPDLGFHRG